jgi:hypothetical protein
VGLEHASRLASEHDVSVEWIQADLREYRPEPRAFDLVLLFYLQVPREERSAIVGAAVEGVRPGGIFLLVGHHADNIAHGYGGPQNPAVLYTPEEIVSDLDESGLRIERDVCVRRPVATDDGEQTALDALVRARR